MADRQGIYALVEKVTRGEHRVDFDKLSEDGSSGGWLLSINRMDAWPVEGFPAANGGNATTVLSYRRTQSNR